VRWKTKAAACFEAAEVVVLVFFFVVALARVATSDGDSHAMRQLQKMKTRNLTA
jgi:hypothetical protein